MVMEPIERKLASEDEYMVRDCVFENRYYIAITDNERNNSAVAEYTRKELEDFVEDVRKMLNG